MTRAAKPAAARIPVSHGPGARHLVDGATLAEKYQKARDTGSRSLLVTGANAYAVCRRFVSERSAPSVLFVKTTWDAWGVLAGWEARTDQSTCLKVAYAVSSEEAV